MTNPIAPLLLLLSATSMLACSTTPVRIVNPDVSRTPVVFESDDAMRAFGAAVADRYDDGAADLGSRQRLSKNAYYNLQLEKADHDADGIITDNEASSYASAD